MKRKIKIMLIKKKKKDESKKTKDISLRSSHLLASSLTSLHQMPILQVEQVTSLSASLPLAEK